MATAREKKAQVDAVKKSVSWGDYDKAERFDLTLKNGLELNVETLTANKVLDITAVLGGKLVDIFDETTEDMPMNKIIEIGLKKLDRDTLADLFEVIFEERRVANLPAGVLLDLIDQYVEKVGVADVFSAGKAIVEKISNPK